MKLIILYFVFSFAPVFLHAQPIFKSNWRANWIAASEETSPNTFLKFRKSFNLPQKEKRALAYIACDSKYWLYINGNLVVFEGQLKRGPTVSDTYFDKVDVSPYLLKGTNNISILMWYWGKDGFCHKSSGKAGLLFQLESEKTIIVSDQSWFATPHLSYQNGLPPYPNFRLPEFNIHYDARLDNNDFTAKDFSHLQWPRAIELGIAGDAPWNKLWERPIPLWKDFGLKAYKTKPIIEGNKFALALQNNLTVTPYFKIDCKESGLAIDIRTDNYFGGSEPNVRTNYITKKGIQEFETPAYMNGHIVFYTFPKGVKVLDLKYRETRFNTEQLGSFSCNDPFFDKLWTKSYNTLNVNLRDAIQDPDRERAQWWGDAVIILEEIFYSTDSNGVKAVKKSISNLLEWQQESGVLFSPIPAGNWDKELPAQMLAAVGKYGIGKYVTHSGDTAFIRYAYPFIKKYLALWQLGKDGLVQHRSGGWDWHDWGNKIDVPLLDNAWYSMALETAAGFAQHLNLENDYANYKRQIESIKVNFEKYFWRGKYFASENYKFTADDRANGLAVCAGLVSAAQWKALRPMLDTTFHAGPYLEKYILESYFIHNDPAAGLQRMKNRYAAMVNHQDIATLWEGWQIGSATYGGGTYNHGWSGGTLSLLSAYVAGIQNKGNGFNEYAVEPQLGNLSDVKCVVPTKFGSIELALTCTRGQNTMKLKTSSAKGWIACPKTKRGVLADVEVNGQKQHPDFKMLKETEDFVYFECNKMGHWVISVK